MATITAIDGLQNEIIDDLTVELSDDVDFNAEMLEIKVKNAIREVRRKRNYPKTWDIDMIADDLSNNYYDVVHDIALYEYNRIGAEGQSEHSEDDVRRTWQSKDDLLRGVFAFVTVL